MENITRFYAVQSDGYLWHVETITGPCDYNMLEDAANKHIQFEGYPIAWIYTLESYDNKTRQNGVVMPFFLK